VRHPPSLQRSWGLQNVSLGGAGVGDACGSMPRQLAASSHLQEMEIFLYAVVHNFSSQFRERGEKLMGLQITSVAL